MMEWARPSNAGYWDKALAESQKSNGCACLKFMFYTSINPTRF